jgi:drug/metabolite transporter (DMT)-like permease
MPRTLRLAFLALILPPLFWSGNTVLGRLTVNHVPPLTLNALRWGLAALLFVRHLRTSI